MDNLEQFNASSLSIIVPAYNEEAGISKTLESLVENFKGSEIIVVDDGSEDATSDCVNSYENIKLVARINFMKIFFNDYKYNYYVSKLLMIGLK